MKILSSPIFSSAYKASRLSSLMATLALAGFTVCVPAFAAPEIKTATSLDSWAGPQRPLHPLKELVCPQKWDTQKCERIQARYQEIQLYRRAQRAKLNLLKSRHEELEREKQKAVSPQALKELEEKAQALLVERQELKKENDIFNEKIKQEIQAQRLLPKEMPKDTLNVDK